MKGKFRKFWHDQLKKISLLRITVIYFTSVKKGLEEYQKIKKEYGEAVLVSPTVLGTGDFYFAGQYMRYWLDKNKIGQNYVLVLGGNSENKISSLYHSWYRKNRICKVSWDQYKKMVHLKTFLMGKYPIIDIFHHIAIFGGDYTYHLWCTWFLMGYKGLSQSDFYLHYGMQIANDSSVVMEHPRFRRNEKHISDIFRDRGLRKGRTVLISPNSTGLDDIEDDFWIPIVRALIHAGYDVCTNCLGDQPPLYGSESIFLEYREIVPFLDEAGYFIGIRSGLCDIISSSSCKKIILHTYRANHWPFGRSVAYTGMNNMGLCSDAFEFMTSGKKDDYYNAQCHILNAMEINPSMIKKTITINYVDVPPDFNKEEIWMTRILKKRYNVVFSDHPDFLFYSVFGIDFDRYENCVKIFFTGEDSIPNFNECDYAMCHDKLNFGDRYVRADVGERYGTPIGKLKSDWIKKGIEIKGWINSSLIDIGRDLQNRDIVSDDMFDRKFCNFIYSNDVFGEGAVLRKKFCEHLMRYRKVDCPGRILHNMNGLAIRWHTKDGHDSIVENWTATKLEFIRKYKFTIAFENTAIPGHTTEKLIHPFYAYSIPIYWGNPEVVKDFNPKAFINCNDYHNNWDAIIRKIIELDNNKEEYLKMLREPPMKSDFDFDTEKEATEFLYHIVDKGNHPYSKSSLGFSGPNQARQEKREYDILKTTYSYKAMRKIQRFLLSKPGSVPRKILRKIADKRVNKKR